MESSQDILNNKCCAKLPQIDSLRRGICRQQASAHPRPPNSLDDVGELPDKYALLNGEKFLLKDVKTLTGSRILIFGTSSLEVLSLGSGWLSDGTFKAVPSIFTQLYTLHSFLDGAWTPRIYALLSDKHKATYAELLCYVIDLIEENFNLPPSPEFFLSDFQIGFMNAAQSVFPKASIFGCLFHFGQMVWRRMQKAGLQGELLQRKKQKLRLELHSIISLAFIPVEDVATVFDDLVKKVDDLLVPIITHIHDYIHGKSFGRKQIDPVFPPAV